MKKLSIKLFLFISITNVLLVMGQPAESLQNSSYTYLKSNLEFLASDLLEGRETASRGEKLASLFISEELEKYGVLPFGDNGTYFQDFPITVSGFKENSRLKLVIDEDTTLVLNNGENFVFSNRSLPSNEYKGKDYEIVFAGYGIYSEDDNYNSYENLDVEGKVVLLFNGTPKLNGVEVLADSILRKFRRSTSKSTLAQKHGAVGVIVLPNSQILQYWNYLKTWAYSKNFKLDDKIDTEVNNIPVVVLNEEGAKSFLANEEYSYNGLMEITEPNPESFTLNSKVRFEYDVLLEVRTARNIIGLIGGNNKNLSNEYLSLGAHYDHEGVKGGKVYNGADDNGSGTVTILEVARRLAALNENERPVIVMFHTAEEKGLLGAKYLTQNSDFIEDVIVHINIDMVGRKSEDSIYCIGASKISSELGEIIESVNSESTNFYLDYTFDNPNDPQRLHYRSDHVHYANKGIPIAFFYDYMKKDYHRPSDTVEKINFTKMVRMVDLIYGVVQKISNLDYKLPINE